MGTNHTPFSVEGRRRRAYLTLVFVTKRDRDVSIFRTIYYSASIVPTVNYAKTIKRRRHRSRLDNKVKIGTPPERFHVFFERKVKLSLPFP